MAGLSFARIGQRWGSYSYGSHVGSYYSIYSPSVAVTRRLVHTGLPSGEQVCDYDCLPHETVEFSRDVVTRRKVAFQETLSSAVHSKWQQVKEDAIIKEQWRPEGGIAYRWAFFHKILRMYLKDPDWDNGESLVWRPLDRTWKAYSVDMVNLLVNGEKWGPEFKGYSDNYDEHGVYQFEIWYKVRHEAQPQASLFLVGGSETAETSLFPNNPAI